MNNNCLICNANVVNEGKVLPAHVYVENGYIAGVYSSAMSADSLPVPSQVQRINATGKYLLPGMIDAHVHFRQPGAVHKADMASESKAALAGGVTSVMDMPNVTPQTVTNALLEERFAMGHQYMHCNYSFYLAATDTNFEEILHADKQRVCGFKLFIGSSTGNMLISNEDTLNKIFAIQDMPIAVHAEDESVIQANIQQYKALYGEDVPMVCHKDIRSEEACIAATRRVVQKALTYHSHLHILHVSTQRELEYVAATHAPNITMEACPSYLYFSSDDYAAYGSKIKCNPAIKTPYDREALQCAVKKGLIYTIGSDHAPHLWNEKQHAYFQCPSGIPIVQHTMLILLQMVHEGKLNIEQIPALTAHHAADMYHIDRRGYIRKGYYADMILVDMRQPMKVTTNNIYYKCGWSPLEGHTFPATITHTFVNGVKVYDNGMFTPQQAAMELKFNR